MIGADLRGLQPHPQASGDKLLCISLQVLCAWLYCDTWQVLIFDCEATACKSEKLFISFKEHIFCCYYSELGLWWREARPAAQKPVLTWDILAHCLVLLGLTGMLSTVAACSSVVFSDKRQLTWLLEVLCDQFLSFKPTTQRSHEALSQRMRLHWRNIRNGSYEKLQKVLLQLRKSAKSRLNRIRHSDIIIAYNRTSSEAVLSEMRASYFP